MRNVLIVGAGALGNQCIPPLVGHCRATVVDGDRVEEKNLGRQPLFTHEHVGEFKVDVLKKRFSSIEVIAKFIDVGNINTLVRDVDIVIDLADDLHLTALLEERCAQLQVPLLVASVDRDKGQVYVLCHIMKNGVSWPRFNDIFRGRIGMDQDGCDMGEVPMSTIAQVGTLTLKVANRLLEVQLKEAVVYLFNGDNWDQIELETE